MSSRFGYEQQSALQKLATRFKHPLGWRGMVTPWVLDKDGGTRFQLTCDEDALVRELSVRISNNNPTPQLEAALDDVADAILRRRRGYVFEWERLTRLDASEWGARLSADATQH